MSERPLRWWPSAGLAEAGLAVERVWHRWCADWDVPAGPVLARNACEGAQLDRVDVAWRPVEGARCCLWLACGRHDSTASLRALLFPGNEPAAERPLPGTIATEIAHAAWDDLAGALLDVVSAGAELAGKTGPETERGAPPADDARPWSGAVRIRMQSERDFANPIDVHLRGSLAESFMCAHRPSRSFDAEKLSSSLVPWETAFAGRRLRLRVELDDVTLELGSLRSLACGDVLTLPHRLDEPLRVRIARTELRGTSEAALCHAALGARRGHRAVELLRAEARA